MLRSPPSPRLSVPTVPFLRFLSASCSASPRLDGLIPSSLLSLLPSSLNRGKIGDGEPTFVAVRLVEGIELLARLAKGVGAVPAFPGFAALPGADDDAPLRLALGDQHLRR